MHLGIIQDGQRPVERCDTFGIAPYSESSEFLLRSFLSPAHRASLDKLTEWMTDAGMTVRLDPIGNLIGRYEGATPDAPAVMIGSHIDTVPEGGRYDGALGVMLGVECVDILNRQGVRLPFAIEVIAFGDEEGSRFPASMLCSQSIASPLPDAALALTDEAGVTLAEALEAFGLDPALAVTAERRPQDVLAYIEAHIEQGPVLESEGLPLGIVTGIAAQLRLKARFRGMAGHAGTTPMRLRSDALAGAAAAVVAIERIARDGDEDLVATVGRLQASTAAFNVIAGESEIYIDVRAADPDVRNAAAERIRTALQAIAEERGLRLEFTAVQNLPGCLCDDKLTRLMGEAVESIGVRPRFMMSGAGHDAMALAKLSPVAMLFIRCEGGVSHNAAEQVTAEDTGYAVRALLAFLEKLGAET